MKLKIFLLILSLFVPVLYLQAQNTGKPGQSIYKSQARAPGTRHFDTAAFGTTDNTTIRWLGLAGFMVNSRGTILIADPVLKDFGLPLIIEMPIATENIPRVDVVLITHSDADHYSIKTCLDLANVTRQFHSTEYVDSIMKNEGLNSSGHKIGESFNVGCVKITVTPADHIWRKTDPENNHHFKLEDACGFLLETPDGTIWAPGDTRLLSEHLKMDPPDALFFDFSDDSWHFGFEDAVELANSYPNTPLLLYHWGSVDAPDLKPFNADPAKLEGKIVNPERVYLLAPGEAFLLKRVN